MDADRQRPCWLPTLETFVEVRSNSSPPQREPSRRERICGGHWRTEFQERRCLPTRLSNTVKNLLRTRNALVEYVRYLAIRGEVERRLITKAVREGLVLEPDQPEAQAVAREVVLRWSTSEAEVVPIPAPKTLSASEMEESIQRGKEWYVSELTACAKCHGSQGYGDGASQDFDDWTKDWTVLSGIDPKDKAEWKAMKVHGALRPVIDRPRNFAWNSYRGGNKAEDLFRRLILGIEGTPMPPIARATGGNPGLTDEQIWDLVHYVMSIGGDS
jgi:mono/diheme cytochrome c family protein